MHRCENFVHIRLERNTEHNYCESWTTHCHATFDIVRLSTFDEAALVRWLNGSECMFGRVLVCCGTPDIRTLF